MTDPTLADAQLIDLLDSEFTIGGVRWRLAFQRDGVWDLFRLDGDDAVATLHRKPAGTWEITDGDSSRIRQGPDWKPLVKHEIEDGTA